MMKKVGLILSLAMASVTFSPLVMSEQEWRDVRHDRDDRYYDDDGGYNGGDHYDYAKVTDVDPIYETVRVSAPRRECRDEPVYTRGGNHNSYTGTIVGGIVGGVIGNQFGHGRGRDVATIAGTILGGSVGRDVSRNHHGYSDRYAGTREVCRSIDHAYDEQRIVGYHVAYRYKGQTYHTRTNNDPGDKLRIRVSVSPYDD